MNTQPTQTIGVEGAKKAKLSEPIVITEAKSNELENNSVILYKTAKVNLQTFEVSFEVSEKIEGEKRTFIKTVPVELVNGLLKEQVVEFINESLKSLKDIDQKATEQIQADIEAGHIRTVLLSLKGIIETPKGLRRKDGKNPFNTGENPDKSVAFYKVNEESFSVMVSTKRKTFTEFAAYSYAIRNKAVEPKCFVFTDRDDDAETSKKAFTICRFNHAETQVSDLDAFLLFYQNVLVKKIADKKLAELKSSGTNSKSFFATETKKAEIHRKGVQTAKSIVSTLERFENKYQQSMRKYAKVKNGEKIPVATFEDSVQTPHK